MDGMTHHAAPAAGIDPSARSGGLAAAMRIVVTGRGVMSAIGQSVAAFEAALESGCGGIRRYADLLAGHAVHAGLVGPFEPPANLDAIAPGCDRTAALAAAAAVQALAEAGLLSERDPTLGREPSAGPGAAGGLAVAGEDIALLMGSSHGGRAQLDRFAAAGMPEAGTSEPSATVPSATAPFGAEHAAAEPSAHAAALARGVMEVGRHDRQTAVVAALLGIHGPALTLSTACSSSGTAIAHGIDLLRSGQVRVALAGGADGFSLLTLAGFQALGAVAEGACGPFGGTTGISLGEGAAFVVLERLDDALARGAAPIAELYGCATTWDAHHLTAPEPSGDGMRRAIEASLQAAGLGPEAIDHVSAHGTGTRANDIAETLALKRVFAAPPPVSAIKSFTGHTLGASSAMGLLAGIAGALGGFLPPTLNFGVRRAGCDLDYVPDVARPASTQRFISLSAAFGGCNCAIAAGAADAEAVAGADHGARDAIVVTGMGVMSPLGCDPDAAYAAALDPAPAEHVPPAGLASGTAGVRGFDPRRHLPRGRSARMNRITQWSVAAVEQALSAAGWPAARRRPNRIGLMVGLSRGAAGSFEACMESVRGGAWHKASPTAFPNLVMSALGGQVAIAVGLKGAASTLIGEADVGLAVLGSAATLLAQRPSLDAVVVLAADELTPLFLRLQRAAGSVPALAPAEGAVALVLERRGAAQARGARILAEIAGWAQSCDAAPVSAMPPAAPARGWLDHAVRRAVARAGETPAEIGFVLAMARGEAASDRRMEAALRGVFGNAMPPLGALGGHAGWGEASGGLLAVAIAVQAMRAGRVPAPGGVLGASHGGAAPTTPAPTTREPTLGEPWLAAPCDGAFARALVAGSSRDGSNAAVVLRAVPPPAASPAEPAAAA